MIKKHSRSIVRHGGFATLLVALLFLQTFLSTPKNYILSSVMTDDRPSISERSSPTLSLSSIAADTIPFAPSPSIGVDITGDGLMDEITVTSQAELLLRIRDETGRSSQKSLKLTSPASNLAIDDIDRNGELDIIAVLPKEDLVEIIYQLHGRFDEREIVEGFSGPDLISILDLNGDAVNDLAILQSSIKVIRVIINGLPQDIPLSAN